MDKDNNSKDMKPGGSSDKRPVIIITVITVFLFLFMIYTLNILKQGSSREIKYNEFIDMIDSGKVKEVILLQDKLEIIPKDSENNNYLQTMYYTGYTGDQKLIDRLLAANVKFGAPIANATKGIIEFLAVYVMPLLIVWGIMFFLYRSISKGAGNMMGVGKSNAKIYVEKRTGVTFKDVAGEDEAKESLKEMVDFLHNPGRYEKIGAKLPKGALLVGPPGTGKTLLAKAVAGEANVPFFSLSGSDFVEMFVGVGASRVRDLFKQAKAMAPCIIFIDEIDAIGKSRDSRYGGANDEREQTLNQLLSEMDGFDSRRKGIVILAATNRPEVLDKALLRPGRFDRRVIVDRPDLKGRLAILKVHSKDVLMDDTVDLDEIAMATAGVVGSDLANMINEAAIMAVKAGRNTVSQKDLIEAVEVVIAGKEKKDRILGKEEKKLVAYHEVGHALVTATIKNSDPVQKITIVPRTMGSLGYTLTFPKEEKFLQTKEELETEILTLLGGRAAEDVVFDTATTGASNDIERATNILRAMITQYGMSDTFGMVGFSAIESKYLDNRASYNCAEDTQAKIDAEITKQMKIFYDRVVDIMKENRNILDEVSAFLIEKETISGKEFMDIYRRIKGIPEEDNIKEEEEALWQS